MITKYKKHEELYLLGLIQVIGSMEALHSWNNFCKTFSIQYPHRQVTDMHAAGGEGQLLGGVH